MEAPGIEVDLEHNEVTTQPQSGATGSLGRRDDRDDGDSKCPIVGGGSDDIVPSPSRVIAELEDLGSVVETALARALEAAAGAGRWELVGQLAAELAERRRGRETAEMGGQVVQIGGKLGTRRGGAA